MRLVILLAVVAACDGGRPSPDPQRSVVALRDAESGALVCSGVAIGRRRVLTARHCVQRPRQPPVLPVVDGIPAAHVALDSATYSFDGDGLTGRDVAVLVLASDIDAPAALLRATPVRAGEHVAAIGFGRTPAAPAGVSHVTQTRVRRADRRLVITDPATCAGDSGGPLVDEAGRVVAIASTRDPRACGVGPSLFTPVSLTLVAGSNGWTWSRYRP